MSTVVGHGGAALFKLNKRVRFLSDRTVIIAIGKVELGQGIVTAMAQIAAEELDVSIVRIRMVSGDTVSAPDEGITSGSRSINEAGVALRHACAQVREVLLLEAARRLAVSIDTLSVRDGMIWLDGQDSGMSYWDLPHAALLDVVNSSVVLPKQAALHTIVGHSVARLDLPDKVMGRPCFVQDVELPGMLFGRVVRPPGADAQLLHFDAESLRQLPGVVAVVQNGRFLGVVAEREEQAVNARLAAIKAAQWDTSPLASNDRQIYDFLVGKPANDQVIADVGQDAIEHQEFRRFSARYTKPYIAHASIGPSCALARVEGDQIEVWTHSQNVYPLRQELARILDVPSENIVVHHAQGAGCYGHNGADDAALDAILLARAVAGRPVQVQWMRDDEFAWEPYGPAMVIETNAVLDGQGDIVDWKLDVWSNGHSSRPGASADRTSSLIAAWHLADPLARSPQIDPPMGKDGVSNGGSGRNAVAMYDFPRQQVTTHCVLELPLRASSLRSIAAYANIFAIESFIDELAYAANADPVAYRLRYMKDSRACAVIKLAAEKSGWHRGAPTDDSCGMGIGYAQYSNHLGYFAVVIELGIDPDIHVRRAVAAVDVGQIINPDGLINQTEGGIIQAISWTLKEQVRFNEDGIISRGWESYPILTFEETPVVEVYLIDRPDEEPLGAGEIAMGPTAAAIANALHQVLGVRIRDLPITRERVVAAS